MNGGCGSFCPPPRQLTSLPDTQSCRLSYFVLQEVILVVKREKTLVAVFIVVIRGALPERRPRRRPRTEAFSDAPRRSLFQVHVSGLTKAARSTWVDIAELLFLRRKR